MEDNSMDPKQNIPKGREKHVTQGTSGVHRRGDGLGTGPVGSTGGHAGQNSGGNKTMTRAAAGGGGIVAILAVILGIIFGGGSGGSQSYTEQAGEVPYQQNASSDIYTASGAQSADTSVAAGSRDKRTTILGNNTDEMTIMVYMCGTDLESKSGMASSDLQEMAAATLSDNINLIVYTGGCKQWQINDISNSVNQIYQIKDGKLNRLEADKGNKVMTDPATLTEFINYCTANFPANRNELIFWDHGGGSVTGYGYDEKNASKGSMDLAGISKALKNSGITFDFIGFDACLMATAENALMLNNYADYLIASEETEPGIGWYYTDWLTKLGSNSSMATVDIGKNIIDDFVSKCNQKCAGQQTTLSIIDLAEFANTVPSNLTAFADSVSTLLTNEEYQTVSNARYQTREFASSSKIDQIDLVHLAMNMGNSEGTALAKAIQSAVKYNRTSSNMSNAYGVSIYFPYKRTSYVDTASNTYAQINMDDSYTKCIRQFASLQTSGQIATQNESMFGSLFGTSSGGSSSSADVIGALLSGFLGGSSDRSIAGLDSSNISFMDDNPLSETETAEYIAANFFDVSNLIWEEADGQYKVTLPQSQWELVCRVDKAMFYDDGEGYIDLGLDNLYDTDGNALIADTDRDWLAVNGQPVAYYHTDSIETGDDTVFNGYIPALLNGERVKLLVAFDSDHPDGYITGAVTDYQNAETETVAKSVTELNVGDTLDFVCDYYDYDGNYQDSYQLGERMTVSEEMVISNVDVGSGAVKIMYCFTDMYNQTYWTEAIVQ